MQEDRNLLFGVFAVQLGKVSASALMEVAAAWAVDTTKSLAERLVERGALSGRDRELIDSFVREAVAAHGGDASAALETFGGADSVALAFGDSVAPLGGSSFAARAAVTVGRVLLADPSKTLPGITEFPGRYTRQSEHARGGMGRVLLVHDEHLGRDVALKELLPFPAESGNGNDVQSPVRTSMAFVARFLQEARVTSQLEHPAIVPVYELGHRADNTLYYTMKLVRGQSLAAAIRSAGSLRKRLELLPHFVDLCQAVSYAHSRRVLHRDIKPGNVMVGEFGETVLIDWGLAKVKGAEDLHEEDLRKTIRVLSLGVEKEMAGTEYGHALGTPVYMPPEQAKGQLEQIDERSDIYSLGAVLYELLTGRPPFGGKFLGEILKKVISDDPEPVARLEPKAPAELCAICERAMAKAPGDRYASARELLDEMKRFQSGALVRAYRYTTTQRVARIIRHNKAEFATAAAAAAILLGGAAVAFIRIAQERNLAVEAGRRERAARLEAESTGYFGSVLLAAALTEDQKFGTAQETLWSTPEALRGWEWGYLMRECNQDLRTITSPTSGLVSAALSPDGRKLALGSRVGGVVVIDPETSRELYRVAPERVEWTRGWFLNDGSRLLVATDNVTLVCDAENGNTLSTVGGIEAVPGSEFQISPDDTLIAQIHDSAVMETARRDTMQFWHLETAKLQAKTTLRNDSFRNFEFHPVLNEVLAGTDGGSAIAIDATSGEILQTYTGTGHSLHAVAYSSDGERMFGGTSAGNLIVWQRHSEAPSSVTQLHTSRVRSLAVHPSNDQLICSASDQLSILFDLSQGRQIASLYGHSDSVLSVQFIKDGAEVMTSAFDGTVRFWPGTEPTQVREFQVDYGVPRGIRPSADGTRLAVLSVDGNSGLQYIQIVDRFSGRAGLVAAGFADEVINVQFSPDARRLAVATSNKTGYLLDSNSGEIVGEFRGHKHAVRSISFSPDGQSVVTSSADRTARVWDVASFQETQVLDAFSTDRGDAAFISDGVRILTWDANGEASIWDGTTGRRIANRPNGAVAPVDSVAVDPAGRGAWLADTREALRYWDFRENRISREYKILASDNFYVSPSPDGRLVAVVSFDGAVRLIDCNSGRELLRLAAKPGDSFTTAAWSPDGRALFLGDDSGRVRVYEADPWRLQDLTEFPGGDWRSRYSRFKEGKAGGTPVRDADPVFHTVTLTRDRIGERFRRWADRIDSSLTAGGERAQTALTVDGVILYPVLQRFGLCPGDVLVAVGGEPFNDPAHAVKQLRSSSASPSTISIVRNGVERKVRFVVREPELTRANATISRELAQSVIDALPELKKFTVLIEAQQRNMNGWYDQPLGVGGALDGIWVQTAHENLATPRESGWARTMNGFFREVGLQDFDRVRSINDIPITSIASVWDAIAGGTEAVGTGRPFSYVLLVERSPFEHIELTIDVV